MAQGCGRLDVLVLGGHLGLKLPEEPVHGCVSARVKPGLLGARDRVREVDQEGLAEHLEGVAGQPQVDDELDLKAGEGGGKG